MGLRSLSPALLAAAAAAALSGCSLEAAQAIYPTADLRPPALLEAGPSDARTVRLRFDEAVALVAGSLAALPRSPLEGRVEGELLSVGFGEAQSPGADYRLSGEVDDLKGNRTRFLLRFSGWNDRAPGLRISEVQTGKNGSKSRPHRDFVELVALADGNVGGEELSWTGSTKSASYRFPAAEVRKGDFLVLHLAPEGLPQEIDELGSELGSSGGIDASPTGRDLWCSALALPDSSAVLSVAPRPGAAPADGLFYSEEGKAGSLPEGRLPTALAALAQAGLWPLGGASPAWEDGFRWRGSSAKSICRGSEGRGASAWYACAAGAQSPGAPNGGPEAEAGSPRAKKARARP